MEPLPPKRHRRNERPIPSLCQFLFPLGKAIWMFPYMGWFIIVNPLKMDDKWGTPISGNPHFDTSSNCNRESTCSQTLAAEIASASSLEPAW